MNIGNTTIFKPVKKLVNSERFNEIAEHTIIAVSVETTLKALARPTFTYLDKKADKESKKYSAAKEFLYQAICLSLYLSILPTIKKHGYNFIKNRVIKKNSSTKDIFNGFEKAKQAIEAAKQSKNKEKIKELTTKFKDDVKGKYKLAKGAIELSSIIGSVLTLTIFAPQVSHFIIHPLMKTLGLEKKPEASSKPQANQINTKI